MSTSIQTAVLILGNQLFPIESLQQKLPKTGTLRIFMREDEELCTHFKYHQHKIIFFLAAMRQYANELRAAGFEVYYEKLGEYPGPFESRWMEFVKNSQTKKLFWFEIEDRFFEKRIEASAKNLKIPYEVWQSPMFFLDRPGFQNYLQGTKKPFMKTFYEGQRKRFKILVDSKNQPTGGKWSFDEDNRKSLPSDLKIPEVPAFRMSKLHLEVAQLVNQRFADHPGRSEEFWLPTDRTGALQWLEAFLAERFKLFGDYEDALSQRGPFLFHSVLTPYLNTGLLTPHEVVQRALAVAQAKKVPLNSCEGFIRQILGWREFIRGIYQNFNEKQDTTNFWNHQRKLTSHWYQGNTGIEPLDDVIRKTLRYGYAHHIERLMVVGSLMLLLEVHPHEAYRWFMEMFIDSSDWVMGPNVYGMALFSDGGIFATKPYICGSNYYKKMGGYKSGQWQVQVDGLYWSFIDRNRAFFSKNPRLSMMVKLFDKMPKEKQKTLLHAATQLKDRITQAE